MSNYIGDESYNPNLGGAIDPEAIAAKRYEMEDRIKCPPGYIPAMLSTRGLISGAPAEFFVRNFSPEDIVELGLSDSRDLPLRLIKVLNKLIYNPAGQKPIRVEDFHEKEVVELLLLIYEKFYTTVFANQTWIPDEEDINFLKQRYGGDNDEFRRRIKALKDGEWKPKFDLDISRDISYYEIPDDFKHTVHIEREFFNAETNKMEPFVCEFSLPKFGDFVIIKEFLDQKYDLEDRRHASIVNTINFQRDAEQRVRDGENIDLTKIHHASAKEQEMLDDYETTKSLMAITASKALYLSNFDGKDVSHLPIEKKIAMAQDPRLDYSTFTEVQRILDSLEFGYKEEITVHNPIQEKVTTRKYTFQLSDLLEAIRDTRPASVTISVV